MSSSFAFSSAAFPASNDHTTFVEGYRKSTFKDNLTEQEIPSLVISVSKEKMFDLFLELVDVLGDSVDVILESSHDSGKSRHIDHHREGIDKPILESYLREFEETLLNDGCSGVPVMAQGKPMEVQFDEHKVIVVYAQKMGAFEKVLRWNGIPRKDHLLLVNEVEHCHSTSEQYEKDFYQLVNILGCSEAAQGGISDRML